jgi:hypothetical protein
LAAWNQTVREQTTDIKPPESWNVNAILPAMERLRTTRVGAIAVSGIRTSTTMKAMNRTEKVTRRPMIFGADQE